MTVEGTVGAVMGPENAPLVSAYGPKLFPPTCSTSAFLTSHLLGRATHAFCVNLTGGTLHHSPAVPGGQMFNSWEDEAI